MEMLTSGEGIAIIQCAFNLVVTVQRFGGALSEKAHTYTGA